MVLRRDNLRVGVETGKRARTLRNDPGKDRSAAGGKNGNGENGSESVHTSKAEQ